MKLSGYNSHPGIWELVDVILWSGSAPIIWLLNLWRRKHQVNAVKEKISFLKLRLFFPISDVGIWSRTAGAKRR